jgi:protein-S-isoprenylcysteine O-methyltransferase Ste14
MAYQLGRWVWVSVGVYWLIAALRSKRAARRERGWTRLLHLADMTFAFALLFSDRLKIAFLGVRVFPRHQAVDWTGLVLTLVGCAVAVWARGLLAENWGGRIALKEDHELIRTGPYAVVRHPIYSGFLLGLLGTAISLGEVRGFIGVALAAAGWLLKARVEERLLSEHFGVDYLGYCRETKRLIPYVF